MNQATIQIIIIDYEQPQNWDFLRMRKMNKHNLKYESLKKEEKPKLLKMEEQAFESEVQEMTLAKDKNDQNIKTQEPILEIIQIVPNFEIGNFIGR